MSEYDLKIEIFSAPCCNQCDKAFVLAEKVVNELGLPPSTGQSITIDIRKISVVEELDYAVALGVLATPSIAINSELVFTSMPTAKALRLAIQSQLALPDQEKT
ncbi:MAG: thioredoxin family protein [Ectothiorhodospiraceae bacterium]|nr:thioredoxin family protein [Ectothiorhodospiraceae bacterium]